MFMILKSTDKMTQIRNIMDAMNVGDIPLLYDKAMTTSREKGEYLAQFTPDVFDELHNAAALFFTSGTSGNPIGVVKTQEHIECEIHAHTRWLEGEYFEQCLVTVPFFHIYGFLFGLALPMEMGLEIVTKDDFLPHEILNLCSSKPTLCVTNPVFVRAMLRLHNNINLSQTLFISSSGPLEAEEAQCFEEKYFTRLIQLYGSSETGGIAIRSGGNSIWTPLDGVSISSDEGLLCVESPFVSQWIFDQTFTKITSPHRTTDIIEMVDNGFKITGRASELVKIGGKRLSIIEIETFLEKMEGIEEALGFVEYHPQQLRGESLTLYLVGDETKIHKTILKKALHDHFGGIHIESKIMMVEKIQKTAMGKKIRSRLVT
ncbi:MAG: AMP-binding protein [Sulfuricurvum sp.]|nr:AMP-binding protein [Sulfuricurvum sp.]MDD5385579.1 AMP-binding protein [Sulfuricurvum sp.]